MSTQSPGVARTVVDILRLSTEYLARHGSDSPRLDAELLIAHALKVERLQIYLQFDRPLLVDELNAIRTSVQRRGKSEPIAYIVGYKEFYGRTFIIRPGVLIPRPETEVLVDCAIKWIRERLQGDAMRNDNSSGSRLRIADIATGSGCIACTLAAELPNVEVTATDISDAAIELAQENATKLGVADRVTVIKGSWCEPLQNLGPFDVVLSNPPYIRHDEISQLMRDVRDYESQLALDGGEDGLDSYRGILQNLNKLLNPDSLVAFEVSHDAANLVRELICNRLPKATIQIKRDLADNPRVIEVLNGRYVGLNS